VIVAAPAAVLKVSAKATAIAAASIARILATALCCTTAVVHSSPARRLAGAGLTMVTPPLQSAKARRVEVLMRKPSGVSRFQSRHLTVADTNKKRS
jgi:hypothetical protein